LKKNVKVRLSPEAEEVYNYLKKEFEEVVTSGRKRTPEAQIFERFEQKKELIKQDEYKNKYGITNLFWVELPHFWRMLYSLTDGESEVEIIAFVLDIIDHEKYNKKFGYKGH